MKYIGFDLGDGESAVAVFEKESTIEPTVLPLCGRQSLLTAVGMKNGNIIIGEQACAEAPAESLSVRFKSRFTAGTMCDEDVMRFTRGVLAQLREAGLPREDDVFTVGCPAGWNAACRARYRDLLLRAGIPDPHVISESRAAFLYAKYARAVALDTDILNESALVVDIGSSTLDFAYIVDGRENGVGTFGAIALGGGVLDAALLRLSLEACPQRKDLQAVFYESHSWQSYCEIRARRLKEAWYASGGKAPLEKNLLVCYDGLQRLTLRMDGETARMLETSPLQELNGKSFENAVLEALENAARVTAERPPRLLLLTGGASRMPLIRDLCARVFENAVTVVCPEPEFSIAKGLAYAGRVDTDLAAFRAAVDREMSTEHIAETAMQAMPQLLPDLSETLSGLLLEQVMLPAAREWKNGTISTLDEMNRLIGERAAGMMNHPDSARTLAPLLNRWVEQLQEQLQPEIHRLCEQYHVPRRQMQLNLTAGGSGRLELDPGSWSGLNTAGNIMGVLLSALGGLLCGGSGIALVAAGPLGVLTGILIGALAGMLGWKGLSGALLKADIPPLLRHIGLENRLRSPASQKELRKAVNQAFEADEGAWKKQMANGFSESFRAALNEIARAAEIPIE